MSLTDHYDILQRKWRILFISILFILIPIGTVLSLYVGTVRIPFSDVLDIMIYKLFGVCINNDVPAEFTAIIWDIRLPRILTALVAGAGLAIAGSALQGALRNPLVSPFTLGISSAASFGAALAIVLGIGLTGYGVYMIMANAFAFSMLAVLITVGISRLKGLSSESLILAGIAVMYLFSALVTLLEYIAQVWELKALVYWIMGDLSLSNWVRLRYIALSILVCIPIYKYSWDLNILTLGDETAKSLGTNPGTTRLICVVLASLITSMIVCMTGPIGFIGLVAPHMARLLLGSDYRYSMVGSLLVGSLLLLASDTIARALLTPIELPVGVVTAFLGVPLFIHLLLRSRREIWR